MSDDEVWACARCRHPIGTTSSNGQLALAPTWRVDADRVWRKFNQGKSKQTTAPPPIPPITSGRWHRSGPVRLLARAGDTVVCPSCHSGLLVPAG